MLGRHVVLAIVLLAGCHNYRQDTLRADLLTLKQARDEYTTWDTKRQLQLVDDVKARSGTRAEAEAAVALFQQTIQAVMIDVFAAGFESIATAATQSDKASLTHSSLMVEETFKVVHGRKPTEDLPKLPPTLPCKQPTAAICAR